VGQVFDSLLVDSAGQSAYTIQYGHKTYIQKGIVRHTGLVYDYAEGIYIGSGSSTAGQSDSVRVLGMTLGPGIRDEHVDAKGYGGVSSIGCLVQGNTSDATGSEYNAPGDPGSATNGVYADQGASGCRWISNTITGVNSSLLSGFFFYRSVNPHASNNSVTLISGYYGYRVLSPVTNPDLCTNNTGTKNYTC
jgi:hypothetical protein